MSRCVAEELMLVKLGGSVITDKMKPFAEKMDVIRRLAREIHSAKVRKGVKLVLGHGGGSYPHIPAHQYQTHKGLINAESLKGVALVQDAAARLNRFVVAALIEAGENAVSVQPSSAVVAKNSRVKLWDLTAVKLMLKHGLLPVTYGDVAFDTQLGCCILSTEEVFRYLATRLKVGRIIVGSNVNGVYDKDPKGFPDAKHIPVITPRNVYEVLPALKGANTIDVTGGMRSKVLIFLELVREIGVECEILDATKPRLLEEALVGKRGLGTLIKAD